MKRTWRKGSGALAALLVPLVVGCSVGTSTTPSASGQGNDPVGSLTQPRAAQAQTQAALRQPVQLQTRNLGQAGAQIGTRGQTPAAQVYAQNAASVVSVSASASAAGRLGTGSGGSGTGSGFIVDPRGYIVTNNHVVEDARELTVTFGDHATVPATLVGRDPDNDLAVIKVDPNAVDDTGRPIRDRLRPVALGNSDDIIIGEEAIAIGSPLGLDASVTSGIVSAIRAPGESAGPVPSTELLGGAIQTDAAINPGNSGGPLFNAAGEVIGVNQAILSRSGGNMGIGFAIPINVVKRVAPVLIERGCYPHPLIGVSTIPLSIFGQQTREQLGIPANQSGLLVQEVSGGAQRAGLRAGERVIRLPGGLPPLRLGGDVIVAVNGQRVSSGGDLRAFIENNTRPGDTVTLTVLRNGQRIEVPVQLTQRENDQCR